jgi:hypothetical protein
MAILQISQIQIRRGLNQDLPQLASGEMAWSLDTRQLYIGNGTLAEGSPSVGVTEVLTQYSDLIGFLESYTFKGLSAGFQTQTGVDTLHPVVRTLQNKLDDIVSVKDFGAVGDGATDDTAAIQRALTSAYATNQIGTVLNHYKTVYFPAGQYLVSSTITIPPYLRIQGEGKLTTYILGTFAGPVARLVDSLGQSGTNFGYTPPGNPTTGATSYNVSDISFFQNNTSYNQSCLVIDGCYTSTFNRVGFYGLTGSTSASYSGSLSATNPIYNIDRGTGIAGVELTGLSNYIPTRDVTFNQCDFSQLNYGIEANNNVHGTVITDCYFDSCYHFIVLGNNTTTPAQAAPHGFNIANNYFRNCADVAVLCLPFVTQVTSVSNNYFAYGIRDFAGTSPSINPYNLALTSAIVFNNDNNFSIGDTFIAGPTGAVTATAATTNYITVNSTSLMYVNEPIRFLGTAFGGIQADRQYYIASIVNSTQITVSTAVGGPSITLSTASGTLQYNVGGPATGVPYINDNGYLSYQVVQDLGVVDGRRTVGRGRTVTLANAASFTSAGINYIPSSYTNLTMNYTLNHASSQRAGVFSVTQLGGTYNFTEEYNETGTSGVSFRANATTGDIEYTSTTSGATAVLTYSLNYFTA